MYNVYFWMIDDIIRPCTWKQIFWEYSKLPHHYGFSKFTLLYLIMESPTSQKRIVQFWTIHSLDYPTKFVELNLLGISSQRLSHTLASSSKYIKGNIFIWYMIAFTLLIYIYSYKKIDTPNCIYIYKLWTHQNILYFKIVILRFMIQYESSGRYYLIEIYPYTTYKTS